MSEVQERICNTQRECVARGAAILDENKTGWFNRIDFKRFDIAASLDCVLGQVFGNYSDGITSLLKKFR